MDLAVWSRASWRRAAPDVIKIGDRYRWPMARPAAVWVADIAAEFLRCGTRPSIPNPPISRFGPMVVASSDGVEDCDAIDPAFLLDPTNGRLWLTYGTYFGFIRIVELDPKTGKRVGGNQPVNIAIDWKPLI